MKEDTIRGLLKQWCDEYGINPDSVHWCGYKDLSGNTMGECWHKSEPYHYPWYFCEIYLDTKWKDKPLGWLETSVLWHEYAHAEAYLEDGVPNSHDEVWKAKRNRKLKYVIGDAFAKFLFPIL